MLHHLPLFYNNKPVKVYSHDSSVVIICSPTHRVSGHSAIALTQPRLPDAHVPMKVEIEVGSSADVRTHSI